MLGRRRVCCEIIEADEKGCPPQCDAFNTEKSLLDVIVEKKYEVVQERGHCYKIHLYNEMRCT